MLLKNRRIILAYPVFFIEHLRLFGIVVTRSVFFRLSRVCFEKD